MEDPHRRTVFRAPDPGGTTKADALSPDLIEGARRRFIAAAWLISAIFIVYFVLYNTVWVEFRTAVGFSVAIAVVVASLPLVIWLSRGPKTQRQVVGAGIGLHLVLGLALAFSEFEVIPDYAAPSNQISWNCVNILMIPLLMPAMPRTAAFTSVGAAFANPIALFTTVHVFGQTLPDADVVTSLFLPPFLCCGVAVAMSKMIYILRREVSEARQLGAYQLVEQLGEGGMGEVWRAEHRMLIRPAAVKLIRAEALASGASEGGKRAVERFEREAQTTASLESPHTVELYDFGVAEDGTLYYVMELLTGIDLQTMVEDYGPLEPSRVIHLLIQACDSLGEAHRQGLVHRDIKPANLFLTRRGETYDYMKVLDFGLVKVAGGAPEQVNPAVTADGVVQGTPAYLAPESVLGETVDGRADLYALGCVGYFLLTAKPPFERGSAMALALAHAKEDPVPPSEHRDVPADLEVLLLGCLKKDPDARPQTARALSDDLRRCLEAGQWTGIRARAWWEEYLPELAVEGSLGTVLTRRPPKA
ncbi:MAG: serine/threonine-protein kinase [Myxococcota bacterium]